MAAKSKFEDTISGLSSTQLEDYIIGYARKDRSFAGKFAEYVKSRLLDDDDTGVRREVAGLFFLECPIRRYDDDIDWYGIMGGINDLFDRAYEALGKGQIRKASGVALAWLDGLAGSFSASARSYDSELISYTIACETAADIIERAMNRPEADDDFRKNVADELAETAACGRKLKSACIYDLRILAKRMRAMTVAPERGLAMIEKMLAEGGFHCPADRLIIQKYQLLMKMGENEEALSFIKSSIGEEKVCDFIVSRYESSGDYDMAVSLLELAIEAASRDPYRSYLKRKLMQREVDIFIKAGRNDDVLRACRRMFVSCKGDSGCYEELKRRIPEALWKSYLAELLEDTAFSEPSSTKAEILLAEGDFTALSGYLLGISDPYSQLEMMDEFAWRLPAALQQDIAEKYCGLIRQDASEAKNEKAYWAVHNHLSHLLDLHDSKALADSLAEEFRNAYRRRRAFVRILSDITPYHEIPGNDML